ncbi:hypothetical protein ABTZ99_11965 [Actinosynnema sp. NPDC002837]
MTEAVESFGGVGNITEGAEQDKSLLVIVDDLVMAPSLVIDITPADNSIYAG